MIEVDIRRVLIATAFFPPVSYFADVIAKDAIIIEADEHYNKQSYRNRMEILGPNGRQILSFPVVKGENLKQKIRDVKISYDTPWQKIHWKSIETAYNSSPYFLYYKDDFFHFFHKKYDFLFDYNLEIIQKCLNFLKFNPKIELNLDYHNSLDAIDLRSKYQSKNLITTNYFLPYIQVFSDKFAFQSNLSILDLLFNLGPESGNYLLNLNE